jgi:CubicO group peptidase (beta-lactamase class C family)
MRVASSFLSVVCAGVIAGAAAPPAALPRSTPEAQGISSAAILTFVNEAEQKLDALHSFMIVRHGSVVAEGWWNPYAAVEPHMLFSLSKSFTSTAVGLAIADGKLTLDDPVLKFFPEEVPAKPDESLKQMRVRDLLTMTSGHHNEDIATFPFGSDESLVKKFLALPVAHKPGTLFVYNTPASYMLSAIVQKVTGQTVLDYLRPRLFEPLGIANPTWDASKQGISLGGFGLSLRTEDIAKFGQLYLKKGQWEGRQLVPAAWVEAATARQVSNGSSPSSDWEQGYGFQFWRSRHGFYRGDGAHGQFCLVLPQYDTVIAMTSGTRDMGSVMNLVWDRLVPALKDSALPADESARKSLAAKLATLKLPTPASGTPPAHLDQIAGKRFVFSKNPQGMEALVLESVAPNGETSFLIRRGGVDHRIVAAPGAWKKGTVTAGGTTDAIAVSGGWSGPDTYTLVITRYQTPFSTKLQLRFGGNVLAVRSENNIGSPEGRVAEFFGEAAVKGTTDVLR